MLLNIAMMPIADLVWKGSEQMQFSLGRRYRSRNPWLVGVIFFFIGLIFCSVAAVFWFGNQSFLAGSVSTTGQIVSCSYSSGDADMIAASTNSCQPTITFTTRSGQEITFTSSVSSSSYSEGDSITVDYHPEHPADARIGDFISLWLFPLIFGGLGSIFLIIGLCLAVIPLLLRLLLIRGMNNSSYVGNGPYNASYAGSEPYNTSYAGSGSYNSYTESNPYARGMGNKAYNSQIENEQYDEATKDEEYNRNTEDEQ